ncbi:MAG TPA: TM1812 family CRISPR-associated protein, partial [Polyangiaceae bacterium]|nr:TM1812 family CRISPR-associated protein [Polyangiaceae bacterium]
MSSALFFSFLGTNKYVPVHYKLRDVRSAKHEEFAQAAVIECLHARPDLRIDRAVVAVTAAAREKNLAALEDRLRRLGVSCTPLDIPDGSSEDELWQIFDRIGSAIADADHVVLDLTHGFRSLPVTGILALSFFRHVHAMKVDVYYGAFEVLGPTDEVRKLASKPEYHLTHQAPIFDLTPMFELPPWAEAAAEWKRTGRAEGIVERTKPYLDALRKELRQDAPKNLTSLPGSLELLGDSLSLVRHDHIGELANQAVARIDGAASELAGHSRLAPLAHMLDGMKESVMPLVGPGDQWSSVSDDYLEHQVAIARWMAAHGRVVEAFSFLRETVISCAVRIALAAGIEDLPAGNKRLPPEHKDYRGMADGLAALKSGAIVGQPREADRQLAGKLAAWLEAHRDASEAFKSAHQSVQPFRNKLDHCWFGPDHAKAPFTRATADDFDKRLATACNLTQQLVRTVSSDTATETRAHVAGDEARCFLNLSNHPLETWSEAQLRAARALKFGEPRDLDGGMPIVPPEASTEEVARLASHLADRAVELHAAGAHVAGDFSLTHALVLELQARAIRCYAATTSR